MSLKTTVTETVDYSLVNLREYLHKAGHPVLCIGPMSRACVDAVIEHANNLKRPIPLIASRRQIECEEFGGGYVNHWNTHTFAQYVRSRDKGYVHLCRDHGGPWQGTGEADLPEAEATARAKTSFLHDIAAGFDVLHIDPSVHGGSLIDKETFARVFDLYTFVCDNARRLGRKIEIEVGSEQQSGRFSDPHELVTALKSITKFCSANSYPHPLFFVVQTGTLVKEMKNVGFTEGRRNETYDQKFSVDSMEKTVSYLSDLACINGVFIKEHNGDYLSDGSMSVRCKLEMGGVNVAPELGVFESKSLVNICLEHGLKRELEQMLTVFYACGKWEKWLSSTTTATDLDKAIMAGHYTFATPEFEAIKGSIEKRLGSGFDLHKYLVSSLRCVLTRMTWNLNYFGELTAPLEKSRSAEQQPCITVQPAEGLSAATGPVV